MTYSNLRSAVQDLQWNFRLAFLQPRGPRHPPIFLHTYLCHSSEHASMHMCTHTHTHTHVHSVLVPVHLCTLASTDKDYSTLILVSITLLLSSITQPRRSSCHPACSEQWLGCTDCQMQPHNGHSVSERAQGLTLYLLGTSILLRRNLARCMTVMAAGHCRNRTPVC